MQNLHPAFTISNDIEYNTVSKVDFLFALVNTPLCVAHTHLINRRSILLVFLLSIFGLELSFTQNLEIEFLEEDYSGNCTANTDCDDNILCFGLKYTPSATGTITSYTLGFMGDCGGNSLPFTQGVSCVMNDNSSLTDECLSSNAYLFISSGNSGTTAVEAGTPVILHTLCFDFEISQLINLEEDPITGLTVSIDSLNSGNPITEFPAFTPVQLSNTYCPCEIQLLSPATTLDQSVSCLDLMDSIKYAISPYSEVNILGLPKGVEFDFTNNVLSIFGQPAELGIFEIDCDISAPCDTILNFNLDIATPTNVMIKNNCYLEIQDALSDILPGDTINIIGNIITNAIEPINLPDDIFIKLQNNIVWRFIE